MSERGRRPLVAVDARMLEASGIGVYLEQLLPRLVALDAWRLLLLGDPAALAKRPWSEAAAGILPHRAPFYGLRQQLLPAAVRGARPDLVWVPHYNAPLAWRGRLLVTVHDLAHLALPEVFGRGLKRLYARLAFGGVRRRAAGVLFDSRFTRDEFHRLVGAPRGAHWTVPLGVGEEWFGAEPALPTARPYLVFVGNIKPHKNLGRLLAAFQPLLGEIPHDLVLAGRRDGFITADRSIAAAAAALGDRVRFTGELAADRLRAEVAGADALVLPSLYEGFGLPALEAMACGRPVLAARAGALPEVCGEAALLCDPRDPRELAAGLRRIVSDAGLRRRLAAAGPARARRFRWEDTARGVAAAAEQVLARG